jgi:hypothetical protein
MFVGHFALGLAAKRAAPRVSLGVLFLAAQLADVLWPVFVAAGLETVRIAPGITVVTPLDFVSYPYSHSFAALVVWAAALGGVCAAIVRGPRTFLVVGGLVLSHWLLDVVSHRPDMPLYPGGATYGLSLWNSLTATLVVELALFGAGVWLYVSATRPRDRIGRWSLVALIAFLLVAYVGNLAGGPPPSVAAIYWLGIAGAAIILLWSWWADRHRATVPTRG